MSKNVKTKDVKSWPYVGVVATSKKHYQGIAAAIAAMWGEEVFVIVFAAMTIAGLARFLTRKNNVVLCECPNMIPCTDELIKAATGDDERKLKLDLSRIYTWDKTGIQLYFSGAMQLRNTIATKRQKGSTSYTNQSTTSQKKSTASQKKSTASQKKSTASQSKSTASQSKSTASQSKSTASQSKSTTSQQDRKKRKREEGGDHKSKKSKTAHTSTSDSGARRKHKPKEMRKGGNLRQGVGGISVRDTSPGISNPKKAQTGITTSSQQNNEGFSMPSIRNKHQGDTEKTTEPLSPILAIRNKHQEDIEEATDLVSPTPVYTNQGQEQSSRDHSRFGSLYRMGSQSL